MKTTFRGEGKAKASQFLVDRGSGSKGNSNILKTFLNFLKADDGLRKIVLKNGVFILREKETRHLFTFN